MDVNINLQSLLLGASIAALVAGFAFYLQLLTTSGAIAAFILGTVVFGLGGLNWAIVLILFFVASSVLSLLFKKRKKNAEESYDKNARRDYGQVIANGGVAGLLVIFHIFLPESAIPWIGFCAALAAANADTWATELGVLDRTKPRLITTGRIVESGTSGGISTTGTLAAIGGAILIGIGCLLFWPSELNTIAFPSILLYSILITGGGVVGSFVDSWLGATVQTIYFCPVCDRETEKHPLHSCGTAVTHFRGKVWMNNDLVNLLCTLSAALFSIGFVLVLTI